MNTTFNTVAKAIRVTGIHSDKKDMRRKVGTWIENFLIFKKDFFWFC